ncbi:MULTISPECIES: hypothetical protein [Natrialbaceae]|uniref:hypothetical protein n=1 Tax=Natrialbaceae TaxID=1644061 RepID=UPI00207C6581|nr:hypothetical protein [Natronococcus sp. CG52]
MLVTAVGIVLVAVGIAGVRYAPAIVETQRRQRMAPLENEELDESDRVRATKGTGVVVVLVGLALVGYGAGL